MPGRFLVDTHVAVEIATAGGFEAMPAKVRRVLRDADAELLFSVVSQAEVAVKAAIGKLAMDRAELAQVCEAAGLQSYALLPRHVDRLFALPMHHKDPFDRLLVATALADDLPMISRDVQLRRYKGLRVVW